MPVPKAAEKAFPFQDNAVIDLKPSGTINVGDFLLFNSDGTVTASANATFDAQMRQRAAGIALEASPRTDNYGKAVTPDTIAVGRRGIFRVKGQQAGAANAIGRAVWPYSVGSSAFASAGTPGTQAKYQTGAANFRGVAQVVGYEGDDWDIDLSLDYASP